MKQVFYTMGHSDHAWGAFSRLLGANEVEILVDVRTNPVSRYAPFANHRELPILLESVGIDYDFMGGPLGGKPTDRSLYDSRGMPDYHKMRMQDGFQEVVEQLVSLAAQRRTAILCSEEDPSACHRLLMLGPSLVEKGCSLLHVRGDGRVQRTGQLPKARKNSQQLQGRLQE